jgi:Mg/Co/Ni transporter MgtE
MNDRPTLTLAYLAHAPESAALVLEQIDPREAAHFLDEIPARFAAPVVGFMSAWAGARCIELLSPHRAAAILQNLAFHDSAGLVRLIGAEKHEPVFDALPVRLARRLRNALRYPAGSVGAWIDPEIPSLPHAASVGDAIRSLGNAAVASHVFLHHHDSGRFAGSVALASLIRSNPARSLAELPVVRIQPLSSRATLSSVAFLQEWDDYLMLPVIGRNQAVVGGLSRASLRKGMQEHRTSRHSVPGSMTGHLVSALATTATGLLHVLAETDPSIRQEHKNA